MVCPECGNGFTPKMISQVICGDKRCRKSRVRKAAKRSKDKYKTVKLKKTDDKGDVIRNKFLKISWR